MPLSNEESQDILNLKIEKIEKNEELNPVLSENQQNAELNICIGENEELNNNLIENEHQIDANANAEVEELVNEIIGDDQFVNRCTFKHPFTQQLISSSFTDSTGNALSVYWQRFCQNEFDVHTRGLNLLSKRLERNPNSIEKYLGFVTLPVLDIRQIESTDKFYFDVIYCPNDIEYDIAHSHIQIMKDNDIHTGKVPKNTRRELIDEGILKLLESMNLNEYIV